MPCCFADRLDARARPDQDRRDQAELRRFDRASQRAFVARMRDRRRRRRQRLAEIEQPLVFLVLRVPSVVALRCGSARAWLARRLGLRGCCVERLRGARLRRRSPSSTLADAARASRAARVDRLRALHALVGQQALESVSSRSRSPRSREQLRQRRERLLRLVARDDLLLAADAAPLVGRHRRAADRA